MKNAIMAGVIAGFASGILMFILGISGLFEIFSEFPAQFPVSVQTLAIAYTIWFVISGIIWGAFYAFFYDYIPSKGVRKSLIYGIIIWIITPIHAAGAASMYGMYMWAIPFAIATFFSTGIVYGIVLGHLYRPSK